MKKVIQRTILIFMVMSTLYITKVYAAGSFSISASKTTINKGESVTIIIKGNNAYGQVEISATNANVSPSTVFLQNDTKTVTVTSTANEDIKLTVAPGNGGLGDLEENPITEPQALTINVNKASSETGNSSSNNSSGNGGETSESASKSKEARLSKLGIRPKEYDFSGFSKNSDKEDWNAGEVPNSVNEIEVYAEAKSDKAKVTGKGKVALKEGNNTIKVTVTAEAGNTKTYSLTIKRRTADEENSQTQVSSDATLKKLGIKPDKYDFSGFKKDKTQYSVQVPKDVEEIEIYAEATSSKAKVVGTGKAQLKTGKNNLVVQVAAENGTTQTYTIEVTRGDAEATATTSDSKKNEFGLSSLDISGLTLSPSFKTGTYEYKVDLTEDLSSLDINAIATDDDTTVEILGNEELALGENTITILVRNEKEDKTATYQIIVNKNLSEEEKMSWLKPSTWGREKIIKIIIIAVLIILVVIAVILKIKIAREKEDEEDLEFPGGEELDKALAEHQVLSETAEMQMNLEAKNIKNEENNVYANEFDETNYIEDIARNKNYTENYQIDSFDNSSSKRKGKHF